MHRVSSNDLKTKGVIRLTSAAIGKYGNNITGQDDIADRHAPSHLFSDDDLDQNKTNLLFQPNDLEYARSKTYGTNLRWRTASKEASAL